MFKVGDIVRPKPFCMGNNYLFRVSAIMGTTIIDENEYKLERTAQVLNPIHGPANEQLKIITKLEHCTWKEHELELAEPTPDYPQEIRDVKYYKNELSKFLNKKEEKEMSILKLYEGRKGEEIANNYLKERERILKEDEIQSIIIEMQNQVNTILENQNLRGRLNVNEEELHTANTEEKLEELRKSTDAERTKLRSTLDEIRALFEMTDSYEERIKILKNYGILDKNGKLSV